jgi:DNA-binding NarL/FixJ family response regulator
VERALEIIVINDSPLYGQALDLLLASGPRDCHRQLLRSVDLERGSGVAGADVVLLAPRDWQELAALLPVVSRRLPRCPWLLLAEPRLAGMFLDRLCSPACALVIPSASPEALWRDLLALAGGATPYLPAELFSRFIRGLPAPSGRADNRPPALPSSTEIQCACAVSLGLSNRQIAALLHFQECSVKTYLYRLMQKLGVHDRRELGLLVEQALASPFQLFGGDSVY